MKITWNRIVENRVLFLTVLFIILFAVFSFTVKGFFTFYNLTNMTQYGVELGLLALAEMFVILSGGGGIDLSVGSMLTIVAMIIGVLIGRTGFNPSLSILIGLVAGVLMGYGNGFLVSYTKIPAFIVTLASLYVYKSLAMIISVDPRFGPNPMPVSNFPESFYLAGQLRIGGFPFQVLFIFIPVILILQFLLNRTIFGRHLYGVGSNETAAIFSGINVKRVRLVVYTLSGLLSALAGWIITSRIASARPDIGSGYELQAITIAVLGGVSIKGGEGTTGGVVLSIAIITMLYNGMQLAGIHQIWQLGSLGLVLVGSVLLNQILISRRKI
ncbi:MAG: ABC transporter permease [Candidatus Atribacteria bacterium]|nr:ABC transporter permease [Candidatus Atribacteria bacterium]